MSSSNSSMIGPGLAAGALALLAGYANPGLVRLGVPYQVVTFLPSPVRFPLHYRSDQTDWLVFVVGLVVIVGVVALLSAVARASVGTGRGGAALFLSSWFSCLVGGGAAGLITGAGMLLHSTVPRPEEAGYQLMGSLSQGLLWGLVAGWLVALLACALARRSAGGGGGQAAGPAAYPPVPEYPSAG